ncbi:MAG: DoxX family protein [Gemmatimonadaceae bacterium]|nr:DoxX family protein [Gemmatimonadaceae bacterium]
MSVPAVLQIFVGLGLLNVWLVRSGRSTPYRGGSARSLKEEFAAYGLPDSARLMVGALKVIAGIILLAGLWWPLPVRLAAGVVAALMCGAIAMHIKVKDAAMKSLPAILMLVMSLGIVALR